ncbi:tRNA 1-methyladenosine methyltransferase subunit GCD10 [Pneumocystis jirovecii RU7]|uniref:tRNA (adenine(58)-N(1))-methyltransferase non-catalytic subunit TRM6 n=1 Tax=Pneumocystis jirovecii (strain RU7) TaxID=1408657 RepID=A0A0W4ZQB4_PNEJ7|nr:tRNA 1-methyladenosine methyltransferase subunit GCD10 [Pneumocystis jirovecii RU7]KTW30565.1 hypothetical protein T551_01848 [Pneumocystis jirovecii RU7]
MVVCKNAQDLKTIIDEENPGREIIQPNSCIFLRLPSKLLKFIVVKPNTTINLGKFGTFSTNDIIGHPYGFTYEIYNHKLKIIKSNEIYEIEDEITNNKETIDDSFNQQLTYDEIMLLKQDKCLSSHDIINKIISSHKTYDQKTAYAKDKYIRKKIQKYQKGFTVIFPTIWEISEHILMKNFMKIMDLRAEIIAYILNLGNVQPNGRYIVVDETSGLLVAAILERMNRTGQVIYIHTNEHPNLDSCKYFGQDYLPEKLIQENILLTLNWLDIIDRNQKLEFENKNINMMKVKQVEKYLKKKKIHERLMYNIEVFTKGEFDGLFIASTYEPSSILPHLIPSIAGSCPIIIYSPYREVLISTSHYISSRNTHDILAPIISEIRHRQYQTLSNRIHPFMTSRAFMGYVLSTIKVLPCFENFKPLGKK